MTPSAQSLLNEMARAGYNGRKAGEKLAYIAKEYNAGRIARETAQIVAEPIIREINLKEREISPKIRQEAEHNNIYLRHKSISLRRER